MRRTRWLAGLITAGLVPLLFACQADSAAPGGDELPSDLVQVRIESIEVVGDCDPALDNPGDFQGWVEVWQDLNPADDVTEYEKLGASAKRSQAIHSRDTLFLGTHIQVLASVVREQGRSVSVRAFVNEMDNGVVDVALSQDNTLFWSPTRNCWMHASVCTGPAGGPEFLKSWRREVTFREDFFNYCRFTVNYQSRIAFDDGR